jgi:hypothetical protein
VDTSFIRQHSTRGSIAEYSCTADPGSVEKEQTFEKSKLEPETRDNLDRSKFAIEGT